ncbi:MAG: hypothetical protein HC913_14920 [Microscillaceae bacterium]|nr:hypothetical protein [Microscillaceae bacterium]
MRKFALAIAFLLMVVSVLYFDFLDWNQLRAETRFWWWNFPLRQKPLAMKVSWPPALALAQQPFVFVRYDPAQPQPPTKLQKTGLLALVRRTARPEALSVYHLATARLVGQFSLREPWERLQARLDSLAQKNF